MQKRCENCKYYLNHDEIFGYCKKFGQQARSVDFCKIIEELER